MKGLRFFACLSAAVLALGAPSPALALANRVFVSARSGNNANSCDNISTPCQTLAGAIAQLNPNGEAIVLDSGGYGPVTITQGVTIEAAAGVTAFIHPPSGDAITVNAGASDKVTLRGLTLNVGSNGIAVNSVGTLNVENCSIAGFSGSGIIMFSAGRLNVKGTDVTGCTNGVDIRNSAGLVQTSIDRCHLDGNFYGFYSATTSPGRSTTTATHSTANHNSYGWVCGFANTGQDGLTLELCAGSENVNDGLNGSSSNALSVARYSSCVFSNNGGYGANRNSAAILLSRGNNTLAGNGLGDTNGVINPFAPQ